jgi:hypothetical protein
MNENNALNVKDTSVNSWQLSHDSLPKNLNVTSTSIESKLTHLIKPDNIYCFSVDDDDHVAEESEEFDEAHTGDEAEEKFKKYNAKELDYMLDRAAYKSKPGDAHKQKRARQAKDAAYNLMIRKKYPYVAQPSDENLEEVSDELKARYTRGAEEDLDDVSHRLRIGQDGNYRFIVPGGKREKEFKRIANNRTVGLQRAKPGVASDENLEEGAKVDRMVKHIEKSEKKSGKSKDEAQDIAWATANKRGMLDNKNKKKVKEADIPSSSSDRGAGLGAGRSKLRLEAKEPQVEGRC